MSLENVKCAECMTLINSEMAANKEPCPTCGSTHRLYIEHLGCKIEVVTGGKMKHKRPSAKRPIAELKFGKEMNRDTKRWVIRSKIEDRENDEYHEIIRYADTGEICHECHEKLSEHRGHGSAKSKKTQESTD